MFASAIYDRNVNTLHVKTKLSFLYSLRFIYARVCACAFLHFLLILFFDLN